jgi:hypothetical protein
MPGVNEQFSNPFPVLGNYFFSNLPSAALYPIGTPAQTVDQGVVYSNGTTWQNTPPTFSQKIAAGAIPFIIAPTGSMANNGAITLGTALPTTYANAWINLPANAIQTGSAAGWYFGQMSSASLGTVFNNTYTTGPTTPPANPTPFVSTGPGAYTGVTAAVTGPQITLPAAAMGPNGILRLFTLWATLNNVDAKTLTVTLGGSTILNAGLASLASAQVLSVLYNRGNAAANVSMPAPNSAGLGTASAALLYSAINTALAQTLAITGQLGVATDYLVMEAFLAEVIPG